MPRLDAITKLDKVYQLFTKSDDHMLNPGETEALVGYYKGLTAAGKTKVKRKMIEIFREAEYERGQRDRFIHDLLGVGFTLAELEGTSGDTAATFLRLSKSAQFTRLQDLDCGETGGSEGFCKNVRPGDVARDARSRIAAELDRIGYRLQREHDDEAELGEARWRAVYREQGSSRRGEELLGYAVELPIYADDHDVDRTYYFNLKGELLGDVYCGE
ncbi:MAG: hypothetical protein JXR83_08660 [Deltaproteobacteria bacterium]|nr:hypothetical protein [Deltaproteobacteria bacterium]